MSQPLIGAPLDRADGREKVTGRAQYTGDRTVEGMLHAIVVPSAIAKGRIRSIDDSRARMQRGESIIALPDRRWIRNECAP